MTTLIANTLAYSFKTPLFPLTVGEFFALQDAPTPWIIPVTKKEVLLWKTKNPEEYSLTKIEELDDDSYASMTPIDFSEGKSTIRWAHDYASVVCGLGLHTSTTKVQPLYAKTPNITTPSSHA